MLHFTESMTIFAGNSSQTNAQGKNIGEAAYVVADLNLDMYLMFTIQNK